MPEQGVHGGSREHDCREQVHLVGENRVSRQRVDRAEDREVSERVLG
jgi:hypothetical protein